MHWWKLVNQDANKDQSNQGNPNMYPCQLAHGGNFIISYSPTGE
jgi:hypothetical protein